ncbi:MAG: DNA adenine methylase [Eisenbergiella sp.]
MNSFISWIGGKKLLRKHILELFPEEYSRYIEVFGGAGWVLFGDERKGVLEVYNDINSDLVNLYRCIKYHPGEMQKELQGVFTSRELFFDARSQMQMRGLTDIQRAARFYILIRESYGADGRSFGMRPKALHRAIDDFQEFSQRLNKVVIENLDFEHLISTYDNESALFYADPPYYNAEKYYPDRFNGEDHQRLYDCLDKIKGRFILSYNDCSEIRKLYQKFNIEYVERQNNLVRDKGRRYGELIIKNF